MTPDDLIARLAAIACSDGSAVKRRHEVAALMGSVPEGAPAGTRLDALGLSVRARNFLINNRQKLGLPDPDPSCTMPWSEYISAWNDAITVDHLRAIGSDRLHHVVRRARNAGTATLNELMCVIGTRATEAKP